MGTRLRNHNLAVFAFKGEAAAAFSIGCQRAEQRDQPISKATSLLRKAVMRDTCTEVVLGGLSVADQVSNPGMGSAAVSR